MKKIIVGLLPLALVLGVASAADPVFIKWNPVDNLSSCNSSESHDRYYYIPAGTGVTIHPDDTYWNTNDAFIRKDSSVEVYENGVISQCSRWERMSNIVRGGGSSTPKKYPALIFRNDDGCVLNKPNYTKNDPTRMNAIDAQIHYTVKFNLAGGGEGTNKGQFFYNDGNGNYSCYPNWNVVSSGSSCVETSENYRLTQHEHKGECLNYRVFRCGDGLIDRPDGSTSYHNGNYDEECDPNHPDWKNGKEGQSCNPNTCKIEYEAPVCSSNYDNKKVYTSNSTPYLKGLDSENLCKLGNLTQNTFKQIGTPIQFTWGCTNGNKSTSSDKCTFNQYRCGDGEVNGGGDWSKDGWIDGKEHYEACDPEHPEYKGKGTCNNDCTYATAICGPASSTTPVYNQNYPTSRIKESELCKTGKLKEGSFSGPDANGKYTWICINGTKESNPSCEAQDLRCGDGKKNGNEQCDYNDTVNQEGWGGKWETCNDKCKRESIPQTGPVCNSSISGHTEYTTYSTDWLNKNSGLCSVGKVTDFNSEWSVGNQRKFTWRCSNDDLDIVCTAKQEWCGDGIKNGNEVCDYKDTVNKKGWGDGCSTTCDKATYEPGECGSDFNEKVKTSKNTRYQDIGNPWINVNTRGLCKKGSIKYFTPHTGLNNSGYTYTWQCNNYGKYSDTCGAYQEWCGDGVKNGGEECDYNDSSETNWGNDGCSISCEKKVQLDNGECDDTFNYTLRYGWKYTFYDKFIPGGTRYLYDFSVKFDERKPYDFNQGENPTFSWMDDLGNGVYKTVSTTRRVIKSQPQYEIKTHPNFGDSSYDDIYIEYTIKYSDKAYASKPDDSKLKTHKECAYYKISRCGDGKIDTDWEGKREQDKAEECDPGSEETSRLPDGRICNSKCQIEEPKGTAVIEKTLQNKIEVTHTGQELTWEVKVTASGGNITDFEIWDKMPVELEPNGTSWWELDKKNSQSNIDVKYSSRNPNPKSSGKVNIHYWDVTGTLKEGNSITMLIKTKVKKMPGSGEDILNIACVIKDNQEIDCDEDQPPRTKGYLVPDKTLIGTKEVNNTGDIIRWSLKVTAKGGDVEDPIIEDVLPPVLGYNGYKVIQNPGLSIYIPTTGTTIAGGVETERVEWKVIGTLKENDSIEIELITYAKKMPEKDYDNVLCARPKDKPEDKKCDEEPIPAPKLWIKKYILSGDAKVKETTVNIGDEITYRIEFGNKGTASATITSIKDFLPKNVGYKSSEVYIGGEKANIGIVEDTQKGELVLTNKYKVVDGVHIDIFGGITLAPNTEGYIIMKGEILSGNQDNRINFACIYLNDKKPDDDIVDGERCDNAVHKLVDIDLCEKLDIPSGTLNGGGSKTVTCKTKFSTKADIKIDCGDGATPRYITGSNIDTLYGVCTYPAGSKTYNLACSVTKDGKTYNSNSSCKGNVSVVEGEVPGGLKCQSNIKDSTEELCKGKSWTVPVDCKTDGGRANKIEIFCDDVVQSSGTDISSLTGSCTFSSDGDHKVRCEVDGSTTAVNGSSCEGVYKLSHKECGEVPQTVDCGTMDMDGTDRVKNISCKATGVANKMDIDCGYNNQHHTITGDVSSMTGTCDFTNAPYNQTYTITCYVNNDPEKKCIKEVKYTDGGGYTPEITPHTPEGGITPTINFTGTNCVDVNANQLSYEQGEVLAFYWNIADLSGGIGEWGYEFSKPTEDYPTTTSDASRRDGQSCSGSDGGRIALDSMVCYFEIKDPDGNVVAKKTAPCLQRENTPISPALLSGWMLAGQDKVLKGSDRGYQFYWSYNTTDQDTDDELRSNLNYIPNFGQGYERFGEYKVKLSEITYLQCKNEKWERVSTGGNCESPFMLTNSYTVQKTPSGNLRASTVELSKYRYCEEANEDDPKICDKYNYASNLLNAISVSEYQPNEAVNKAMTGFINKYSRLAVNAGNGLKKVPGKNIYFISKNICLGSECKNPVVQIDKPTTFVQTQGKTTIKGNLDSNLMLLTTGKIVFDGSDENGDSYSCNHRQVVKGIFYSALSPVGIERTNVKKNTYGRKDELERCTEGGLTVKGVLIGRGLDEVMQNSRSNLNGWSKATDKKPVVMNGASVVIEYSPSVFTKSTMPPGAEEFTTALSIYKD